MYLPCFFYFPSLSLIAVVNLHSHFITALADALPLLGINPVYHMRDVRRNGHNEAWRILLQRKLDGHPITVEDFDAILGSYAVHPLPLSFPPIRSPP
jgi:hypothetical protein